MMEEQEDNAERESPRSRESTQRAYIQFVNLTNRIVEILWINFTGQYIRYQLVGVNSYGNIDTYKTHPWIARDLQTKDRLLVGKQYVYMPKTTLEHQNQNPNLVHPIPPREMRVRVAITHPLHSLRYRTLLVIRDLFAQPEPVDRLELPTELREDLKKVIRLRNRSLASSALTVSSN